MVCIVVKDMDEDLISPSLLLVNCKINLFPVQKSFARISVLAAYILMAGFIFLKVLICLYRSDITTYFSEPKAQSPSRLFDWANTIKRWCVVLRNVLEVFMVLKFSKVTSIFDLEHTC